VEGTAVLVEKPYIVPLSDSIDLQLGFTADLVWDYHDRRLDIEDYKFVGRAWSQNKLARYNQLDMYLIFLRMLGYDAKRGVLRFFNTTTGKPYHKVYNPDKTTQDILFSDFLIAATEAQEFLELPVAEQRKRAIRTFNYNTCSWCHFNYPCTLEAQGKDASNTLAMEYTANVYGYSA
jgi:hypothetical protein